MGQGKGVWQRQAITTTPRKTVGQAGHEEKKSLVLFVFLVDDFPHSIIYRPSNLWIKTP
jgi:hypothetical protein